jgi:hypothetical protein
MARGEQGQILPGLVIVLLSIVALGVLTFQVGKAAVLRSQAQTAADAAALAGAREIQRQLQVQWSTTGLTDIGAIDQPRVRAEMDAYAKRNDARVLPDTVRIIGVDVRLEVESLEGLDAEAGDEKAGDPATARARARVELLAGAPSTGGGSIGPVPAGGTPKVPGRDWERLGKDLGEPPGCDDLRRLGEFLVDQGFQVSENRHFGGVLYKHAANGYHYKCGGDAGAIDVNFGACGDLCPSEVKAIDPIVEPLRELGFRTIWRAADHLDHIHIDIANSGAIGAGFGSAGFAGPLEHSVLSVKLIDWDAPLAAFGGLPGATGRFFAGPPSPEVAAIICDVAGRHGPKILLSAFEAAIVESGVHNLRYGDADSLGVFQQRPSVGEWGTAAQILDPVHATRKFVSTALAMDQPGWSAGQLAAHVQRPREDLRGRYDEVRVQALGLIERFCR